jgi:hypothetical protein
MGSANQGAGLATEGQELGIRQAFRVKQFRSSSWQDCQFDATERQNAIEPHAAAFGREQELESMDVETHDVSLRSLTHVRQSQRFHALQIRGCPAGSFVLIVSALTPKYIQTHVSIYG